jgi:hypothetical protein
MPRRPNVSCTPQTTARSTYPGTVCTILGPAVMSDDLGRFRDRLSLAQSLTAWNQFGAIFKGKINKEFKQHLELAHSRIIDPTPPVD